MENGSGKNMSDQCQQFVTFIWGSRKMCIPINQVKETLASRPLTKVFLTPSFVMGVVNVRGEILAVLDLAQMMGLPPLKYGPESKIIIAKSNGRKWGVLVDEMTGVQRFISECINPARDLIPKAPAWLTSVATHEHSFTGILDMALFLETEALRISEENNPKAEIE